MIEKIYNERSLIMRFVIVGLCGFLINYLVLRLCSSYFLINKIISEIFAAIIALQVTFLFNDHWTYKLNDTEMSVFRFKIWSRYLTYIATNSFGSLMTVIMFAIFSSLFDRLSALALAAIIAMIWNYFMNKLFIWRNLSVHKDK